MKRGLKTLLTIILVSVAVCGCDKRPEGVLPEDKMVDLLTDIQMAEAYNNVSASGQGRVSKEQMIESVLRKHGVTHAQLDSTLLYYGRNIDDYSKLYVKVEKRLRAKNGVLESAQGSQADDIWPYGRFAAFLPVQMQNGLNFSIAADNLEPGNLLEWGMRLSTADAMEATLGVEYSDGSASLAKKNLSGNRTIKIELQTDTALTATRIFGILKVSANSMPLWVDSLQLTKAPFDSLNYSKFRTQKFIRKPMAKPLHPKEETAPATASLQTSVTNDSTAATGN